MQSLPLCFVLFCFFSERDDRYNDPKKYLSDINLSQKRTKGPGFPLACIWYAVRTRGRTQIDIRKIERGIAEMQLVLITACFMYRNRFLVISWWTGQYNSYRSCPCVFRAIYTNFHLARERRFLMLSHRWQKCRQENGNFLVFLNISARSSRILKLFGPAYALLSHGQCFQFSSPNLQWLTRIGLKKPYVSVFGWPSSYIHYKLP